MQSKAQLVAFFTLLLTRDRVGCDDVTHKWMQSPYFSAESKSLLICQSSLSIFIEILLYFTFVLGPTWTIVALQLLGKSASKPNLPHLTKRPPQMQLGFANIKGDKKLLRNWKDSKNARDRFWKDLKKIEDAEV